MPAVSVPARQKKSRIRLARTTHPSIADPGEQTVAGAVRPLEYAAAAPELRHNGRRPGVDVVVLHGPLLEQVHGEEEAGLAARQVGAQPEGAARDAQDDAAGQAEGPVERLGAVHCVAPRAVDGGGRLDEGDGQLVGLEEPGVAGLGAVVEEDKGVDVQAGGRQEDGIWCQGQRPRVAFCSQSLGGGGGGGWTNGGAR